MRVERYASECALCRATIYVPAGLGGIHSAEDYCGLCAIHIELGVIAELLANATKRVTMTTLLESGTTVGACSIAFGGSRSSLETFCSRLNTSKSG